MKRCRSRELMDDPLLDAEAHGHALRSLNRINRLTRVDRRLYAAIRQLGPVGRMSVLDLGSGGGGFLHYVSKRRGGENGPPLVGLDRSAVAIRQAQAWYDGTIQSLLADAHRIPLADNSVDVVTCSLFLHHLDEPGVVRVLREAARVARRGIVVDDLSRSRLAVALTWVTTRIVSRSYVFHTDGTRSVRAALRWNELAELARQAGLSGARVSRRFPFRLMLIWQKPGGGDGRQ
jgi:ubiquinone/menaquinone biosynthesis C-methylase UbiE